VQGQLRREKLSVEIHTQCGHCARPLRITLDSDLNYHVHDNTAAPLVFTPDIDWRAFSEANIIRAF